MTTCPKCHGDKVQRVGRKVHHWKTLRVTVWAYWNVCLDPNCLYKWDGVTDGGVGLLPALVKARNGKAAQAN